MTQKPNNPFRSSSSSSNTNPSTRYGTSLNSRFGTSNLACDIAPLGPAVVRFDLIGLGQPLQQLFSLQSEADDREAIIQAIEQSEPLRDELAASLEIAWREYNLCGAALVYPWHEGLGQAVSVRTPDMPPGSFPVYIRALDPLLVLNVLARARSQILLATSPPDLERPFLERSLAADDPRLVAITTATTCAETPFETPTQENPSE